MKKYLVFVIGIVIIISCSEYKKSFRNMKYEVYRIDSINSFYLIYVKKKDSLFKIVSRKENLQRCRSIKNGKMYVLELQSWSSLAPTIKGVKLNDINYLDVQCFGLDSETTICNEKGIYDIYLAKNVKGLCIIK